MLRGAVAGVVVAWTLVVAACAHADVEPNDNLIQAEGPVLAQTYSGRLSTPEDHDWYWVQLGSQQQIALTVSATGGCEVEYALRPYDGAAGLISGDTLQGPKGSTTFLYTTPIGGDTYYLEFAEPEYSSCDTTTRPAYSFSIGPATAFVPPSAKPPIVTPPEPNDVLAQAFGPMIGGNAYTGTIETTNDVEYVYFYARANRKLTLQMAAACSYEGSVDAVPVTHNQIEASGLFAGSNERQTEVLDTGTRAERYVYEISGSLGCLWQLELSPPDGFRLSLENRVRADPCRAARRVLARRRIHLHRAERTLRFTHGRAARARLHHKIEARKRGVRAARHRVRRACG